MLLALFAMVVGLIYLHQFSYGSDDVAEQTIVQAISHHGLRDTWLPPDPWLLKLPLYGVLQLAIHASRSTLLLTSIIMNVLLVVLVFIATKYFHKRLLPKNVPLTHKWVWLVWVFSLTPGLVGFLRMPNTRNFELGILLLAIIFFLELYARSFIFKSKTSKLAIISFVLLNGICFYSDPYYLIFLVSFLGIFFCAEFFSGKIIWRKAFLIGGLVAGSIILYGLVGYGADKLGFHVAKTPQQITPPDELLSKLALSLRGLRYLFSVEAPLHAHNIVTTIIRHFSVFIGLGGFVASGFLVLRKKASSIEIALGSQPFLIFLAYIISKSVDDIGTARYLVLIPLYFIFIFPIALIRLKSKHREIILRYVWIVATINVIVITIGAGMVLFGRNPLLDESRRTSDTKFGNRSAVRNPRNLRDRKIVSTIQSHGLNKGYSDYWGTLIIEYLSNYDIKMGQILCNPQGLVRPYYWVVQDKVYAPSNSKSFFLFDSYNLNHTACQLAIFGPYEEVVTIDDHTVMFIYNYDVASKFPTSQTLSKPD